MKTKRILPEGMRKHSVSDQIAMSETEAASYLPAVWR